MPFCYCGVNVAFSDGIAMALKLVDTRALHWIFGSFGLSTKGPFQLCIVCHYYALKIFSGSVL